MIFAFRRLKKLKRQSLRRDWGSKNRFLKNDKRKDLNISPTEGQHVCEMHGFNRKVVLTDIALQVQ